MLACLPKSGSISIISGLPQIKGTPKLDGVVRFAYMASFILTGILVAYIGFCDPDTCWHLALGRWIFAHHSLPLTDPFSTNVASFVRLAPGLPLVQHEWLSDTLFYTCFQFGGAVSLLVLCTVCSVTSFLVLPHLLMSKNSVPARTALVVSMLLLFASAFRLWVRPESFSFLFLSLLTLLSDQCLRASSQRKLFSLYAIIYALFSLWANMHGLFLVGLAFLIGIALIQAILLCSQIRAKHDISWQKEQHNKSIDSAGELFQRSCIAAFFALLGTLNTPWTYRLLPYVLSLLNSPVTSMNKENGGIKLQDFASPSFYPLVILLVIFTIQLMQKARALAKNEAKALLPAILLGLSSLFTACAFRRLTPLALIVLAAAFSRLYFDAKSNLHPEKMQAALRESFLPGQVRANGMSLLFSFATAIGACLLSSIFLVQPSIPSGSRLFTPPTEAIEFIARNTPTGKLFNDSKYGSMMTWTLEKPPDIFIDGRFDSYERQLVYDYLNMRFCHGAWQDLLRKYNISWLFLPSDAAPIIELKNASDWTTLYQDGTASILKRKEVQNNFEAKSIPN